MKFWKEYAALRVVLIATFFLIGLALVIYGWTLTGKMVGLLWMLLGLILLLTALLVYNQGFTDGRNTGR